MNESKPETYTLTDLRGRTLGIYVDKPSFDKAKETFDKYPKSFTQVKSTMDSASERIKRHIERGNSLSDDRGVELEARHSNIEKLLDAALKGNPSEFFIKIGNLYKE